MRKARVMALVLAVSCAVVFCYIKKGPATYAQTSYRNQRDVLDKYSLSQLYDVLKGRTNKTVYQEPPGLRQIPTGTIADDITYRQKTIYGPDRRKDYFEIQDPDILQVSESVAAIIPAQFLAASSAGQEFGISRSCPSLGGKYQLCSKESYINEPVPAVCTGFVVASDVIATAGHCVGSLGTSRIVFKFREEGTSSHFGIPPIPNSQVYRPMQVIAQKVDQAGADYALVRVDRPIPDHPALKLRTGGSIQKGTIVYVLGYPSGLPLKLADSAMVSDVVPSGYFLSNLDTFGGNSGSPVLNSGNNTVEGILVRGGTDYVRQGTCNSALICPVQPNGSNACEGEASTLISEITSALQQYESAQKSQPSVISRTLEAIVRVFRSGLRPSGLGSAFSPLYQVVSDEPPQGYKIGSFVYSLTGDRGCNAWSTCNATVEGNRVIFRFTLQGHSEWFPPRPGMSEGVLTVTYVPLEQQGGR